MASESRDLTFRFLSQTDRFNLAAPADELEQLGTAARDAGEDVQSLERVDPRLDRTGAAAADARDDLDRLGSSARDAGDDLARAGQDATDARGDLDRLGTAGRDAARDLDAAGRDAADSLDTIGTDAKDAARKVDAAMDAIASSSRRGAGDVDDAARHGGESLRDMGEEGQGTAREMAASFDGTADGISDAMQEAATNVLAALGPVGAAVGVAAGVGIGFLRGQAEQLRERVSQLVGDLIDAGGQLDRSGIAAKLREMAEDGSITEFADQARKAHVPVSDYLRALAGDPDALDRTRTALAKYAGDIKSLDFSDTLDASSLAADSMRLNLEKSAGAFALADEATKAYNATLDVSADTLEAYDDAVAGFTDTAGVYSELLATKEEDERRTAEATAAATKSQTDSWEDYADDVNVSVDEYLDALERQVKAQEEWAGNLAKLAKRGVSEGVLEELSRMGPEGAPLVAALTKASDAELQRMAALYSRKGRESTDNLEDAIRSGRPGIAGEVQEVRDDMRRRLSGRIDVPVGVNGPSAGDLAAARARIRSALSGVTVFPIIGGFAGAANAASRLVP